MVIANCLDEKTVPIYGKGQNIRDWLFVEDHVNALLLMACKGEPGSHYCIGGGEEKNNINICKKICNLLDDLKPQQISYSSLIEFVDDRPGHDARYAINPLRISEELGWRPSVSLEEGLNLTIQWYLDNEDWWQPLLSRSGVGKRLGLKT